MAVSTEARRAALTRPGFWSDSDGMKSGDGAMMVIPQILNGSTAGDSFERLACVTSYHLPGSEMTGRKSDGSGSVR
jgi:hypothetical protein